jgi:hypothetical protein
LFRVWRQVQVGVENLARSQHGAFLRLRLLDLDDHLGPGKYLGRVGGQSGASALVQRIIQADGSASAALHQNTVAVGAQLSHTGWRQADAVLVVLDFLGESDAHFAVLWLWLRQPVSGKETSIRSSMKQSAVSFLQLIQSSSST